MPESVPSPTAPSGWRICNVLLVGVESGLRLSGVAMAVVASRVAARMDFMATNVLWMYYGMFFSRNLFVGELNCESGSLWRPDEQRK